MTLESYYKSALHEQPTTLVLIGPSGAGKSTVAADLSTSEDQVVCTDDLRYQLCGDAGQMKASGVANSLLRRILSYRASHELTTIVDTTALQQGWRGKLCDLSAPTRPWALIVEAPLETCLDRQHQRSRQVPPSAIKSQHERLGQLELVPGRFERIDVYRSTEDELVEVSG